MRKTYGEDTGFAGTHTCGLLCGVEGEEVSICDSWLKKDVIDGRRPRDLGADLMLCSTTKFVSHLLRCADVDGGVEEEVYLLSYGVAMLKTYQFGRYSRRSSLVEVREEELVMVRNRKV